MKKKMILLVIMTFLGTSIFAQDPGDFGDGEDTDPLDAPALTIDLYINVLLVSAAAFAFYKIQPGKSRPARKKVRFTAPDAIPEPH